MIEQLWMNRAPLQCRAIIYGLIKYGDQHSVTDAEKARSQEHLIATLQAEITESDRCYSPFRDHILIELAKSSEAHALLLARLLRNAFQQSRWSVTRKKSITYSIAIGVVVCNFDDLHADCLETARNLALRLDCHLDNEISLLNRATGDQ